MALPKRVSRRPYLPPHLLTYSVEIQWLSAASENADPIVFWAETVKYTRVKMEKTSTLKFSIQFLGQKKKTQIVVKMLSPGWSLYDHPPGLDWLSGNAYCVSVRKCIFGWLANQLHPSKHPRITWFLLWLQNTVSLLYTMFDRGGCKNSLHVGCVNRLWSGPKMLIFMLTSHLCPSLSSCFLPSLHLFWNDSVGKYLDLFSDSSWEPRTSCKLSPWGLCETNV